MRSSATRRTMLKNAALAIAAGITAPYVRGACAAGKLTLGCWDHWVPGANSSLTKICNEWGALKRKIAATSAPSSRSRFLVIPNGVVDAEAEEPAKQITVGSRAGLLVARVEGASFAE